MTETTPTPEPPEGWHYPEGTPPPAPAPGWYPDPAGTGTQRYWDGNACTAQTIAQPRPYESGPALIIIAWVIAVCTLGYMLPWAVSVYRNMPNNGAVALVNLLTGWTGIGWIGALIMACVQRV